MPNGRIIILLGRLSCEMPNLYFINKIVLSFLNGVCYNDMSDALHICIIKEKMTIQAFMPLSWR